MINIKDIFAAIAFVVIIIVFVIGLASAGMWGQTIWAGHECENFCEELGDESRFNPAVGCFCVDDNGQMYNPKYLVPPGTEIRIVE